MPPITPGRQVERIVMTAASLEHEGEARAALRSIVLALVAGEAVTARTLRYRAAQ